MYVRFEKEKVPEAECAASSQGSRKYSIGRITTTLFVSWRKAYEGSRHLLSLPTRRDSTTVPQSHLNALAQEPTHTFLLAALSTSRFQHVR
jgi:hypothetical protein